MHHERGLGVREIARQTGVSPATVSRRLRALQRALFLQKIRSQPGVMDVVEAGGAVFTVRADDFG